MAEFLVELLKSQKLFNYIIMLMYLCSAARWFFNYRVTGDSISYAHGCYWLAALAITATVTFLYQH